MFGPRKNVVQPLMTYLMLGTIALLGSASSAQEKPSQNRVTDDPYFSPVAKSAADGTRAMPVGETIGGTGDDKTTDSDLSVRDGETPVDGVRAETATMRRTESYEPTKPSKQGLSPKSFSEDPSSENNQTSPQPVDTTDDDLLNRYKITERHPAQVIPGQPFEAGHVLAVVGGEPIFVGDLLFDANQLIEKFMPGVPDSIRKRERPKIVKKLLPKFIDEKLMLVDTMRKLPDGADFEKVLEQASKEFDEKALDKIMETMGVNSIIQLDAHLRAQDSSLRQMRRSWSVDQLVRFFVMKDLETETDISHHELLSYYRKNISEFETKARAQWEQIMVRFDRFPSHNAAREAIVELGNKVVYGAAFAETARKSSHGYNAENGGKFDWTTKDSLVLKELDSAIFTLPVGLLSDIIETRDGYHIVRIISREDAAVKAFRDAQVEIREKLQAKKRSAAFEAQLTKLRREIPVEIYDFPETETETRVSQSPTKDLRR